MFKKWFIRCMAALILVIGVLSVTLAYQFTEYKAGVSGPEDEALTAEGTLPPREVSFAELKPVVTVKGQTIDPFDFLTDATPSNVVAFFNEEVNTDSPGAHDVVLTLNNGAERTDVMVTVYILEAVDAVTVEAGTETAIPKARDFIANADILPSGLTFDAELITDLSGVSSYDVGSYNAELSVNGVRIDSTVQVTDTTPPSAVSVGLTINSGQQVTPEEFVTDIADVSPVTVTYFEGFEPDVLLPGEHLVKITLEDSHGNKAHYNSILKVEPNTTPPHFAGLNDMEALLGDPVMYRKGVTAEDAFGNELDFEVDSEAVDITVPGAYPVKYSTEDASGNYIEEEITITVVNITEEAIMEMLNEVMVSIVSDDMTQLQKAEAIFNWITGHVGYVADAPKNSVYEGAYRALRQRSGDCFTFYAIAEVMLTAAGIPNERVTRVEGTSSSHYWNLVNCDGTGWYHFDSTPLSTQVKGVNRFLFTDGDAVEYTEIVRRVTGSKEYYTYDKTLHPEVIQ